MPRMSDKHSPKSLLIWSCNPLVDVRMTVRRPDITDAPSATKLLPPPVGIQIVTNRLSLVSIRSMALICCGRHSVYRLGSPISAGDSASASRLIVAAGVERVNGTQRLFIAATLPAALCSIALSDSINSPVIFSNSTTSHPASVRSYRERISYTFLPSHLSWIDFSSISPRLTSAPELAMKLLGPLPMPYVNRSHWTSSATAHRNSI